MVCMNGSCQAGELSICITNRKKRPVALGTLVVFKCCRRPRLFSSHMTRWKYFHLSTWLKVFLLRSGDPLFGYETTDARPGPGERERELCHLRSNEPHATLSTKFRPTPFTHSLPLIYSIASEWHWPGSLPNETCLACQISPRNKLYS